MMHDRLLLATAGAAGPERRLPDQVTLQVEPSVERDVALYARFAWVTGLFADAGLAVRIAVGPTAGSRTAEPRLAVADATAVGDRQVVAAIHQQTAAGLVGFADTGLATAADLTGRVVGLAPGSVARSRWPAYARRAGLAPAAVVAVEMDDPVAGLVTGRLHAAGQSLVDTPRIAAGTGRHLRVLPYAEVLPDLYGSVLVAPRSLARERPDLVRRVRTALLAAVRLGVDDPAGTAQLLHGSYLVDDPELTAAELRLMRTYVLSGLPPGRPVGTVDEIRVARCRTLLARGPIRARSLAG